MTIISKLGYQSHKKNKSISPFQLGFIWGGIFSVTAIFSTIFGASIALESSFGDTVKPVLAQLEILSTQLQDKLAIATIKEPVNILVMGIDKVPNVAENSPEVWNGRSDTILLVRIQPSDHSIRILSIPRDTRVVMPSGSYDKINSSNVRGGVDFTKRVIGENFNNVQIDHSIRVTTDVFREIIDALGGVEVYVPSDMFYEDKTQKLKIDLKKGKQVLNGEKAEQFSRFRNDGFGDIGRVQRQQLLIKALSEKIKNPMILTRIPKLINVLQKNVDTDLNIKQMMLFGNYYRGLDKKQVKMIMLPGRFSTPQEYSASYWLVLSEKKNQVMKEFFDLSLDSTQQNFNWRSPNQMNIAIQNGSNNPELAKNLAKFLANHDFRNVYISPNVVSPSNKTEIIVQKGNLESAEILQRILNFGEIDASSTGDIDSDLTIKIGDDANRFLK